MIGRYIAVAVFLTIFTYNYYGTERRISPIVQLKTGTKIRGKSVEILDKKVNAFLGIPYAVAPVGPLRFAAPHPLDLKGVDTLDATKLPNSCMQSTTIFPTGTLDQLHSYTTKLSEDCLYLNIWVPDISTRKDDVSKLDVMLYIHGGGFYSGSSTGLTVRGDILAATENIVVVAINYRVAMFGFLYVENSTKASGNVGLLDQLEAIKFVHENIDRFGGHPGHVTLWGQSAGAASVSWHALNPGSWPFFHRFIAQSGNIISQWPTLTKNQALNYTWKLAKNFDCVDTYSTNFHRILWDNVVDCLAKIPAEDLAKFSKFPMENFIELSWAPVVDGFLIRNDPNLLLEQGLIKKCETLIGAVASESTLFVRDLLTKLFPLYSTISRDNLIDSQKKFNEAMAHIVPKKLLSYFSLKNAIFAKYYPKMDPKPQKRLQALTSLGSDYFFFCDLEKFTSFFKKQHQSVYTYIFDHKKAANAADDWMGVPHSSDMEFVFGIPLVKDSFTRSERSFSKALLRFWANFARTGNPNVNPDGSLTPIYWPSANSQKNLYLRINSTKNLNQSAFRNEECKFWRIIAESLTFFELNENI